jgi:MFS family permease
MGIGGIAGGLYAVGLTARRRLGRPFAFALALWGLPIALIGLVPRTPVVIVALLTIGVGNALLDVSGLTLSQRLGADRSLGRVFGVLFTFGIAMGGVAAFLAPILVSRLGLRPVLVLVGAILPVLALRCWGRFRRIDEHSEPTPELLSLYSNISLFHRCHRRRSKDLGSMFGRRPPGGTVIISEGDHGDQFYAIVRGRWRYVEVWSRSARSAPGSLRRDRAVARRRPHSHRRGPFGRPPRSPRHDRVPRCVVQQ